MVSARGGCLPRDGGCLPREDVCVQGDVPRGVCVPRVSAQGVYTHCMLGYTPTCTFHAGIHTATTPSSHEQNDSHV